MTRNKRDRSYIDPMDRRQFTRGLVSLGAVPALPVKALGATATASATAEKMYFVSWYTARLNKTCSPGMLVSELNMAPDVAREVFGKLVRDKTVSLPNAFGISRTLDPLTDSYRQITSQLAKRAVPQQPAPDGLGNTGKLPADLFDEDAVPAETEPSAHATAEDLPEDFVLDVCDPARDEDPGPPSSDSPI